MEQTTEKKTTIRGLQIEHRRPHPHGGDVILVCWGTLEKPQYVTGRVNAESERAGEWYWGHYFESYQKAYADFLTR